MLHRSTGFGFALPSAALAALLAAGCGGGNGHAAGPCDGPMPAKECSAMCSGDAQCSDGYYCNVSAGTCTADCTQGGSECGSGMMCDPRGHCVSSSNGCGDVQVNLTPVVPLVVLLIDQSGSMTDDFGGISKWDAVRQALSTGPNAVLPRLDGQIDVGATLYSSRNGNDNPPCPRLQSVQVASNNAGAIGTLLKNNNPIEDTPTGESVAAVTANFPKDGSRPRILVLATDGAPDTCDVPDPDGLDPAKAASEQAVTAAYQDGITTYVLSVATTGDTTTHLQRLANLGQGMPAGTGSAKLYTANNPQEMVDAFGQIIGGVRSCDITVNGTVDLSQASSGTVILNGQNLMYGTDWTMKDQSTLELLGDACNAYLNSSPVMLSASFPCGGVVVD